MEVVVLNSDFERVGILDTFESLIWTDRYYGCGDFEITGSPNTKFVQTLSGGTYLSLKESDRLMVIESLSIHSDSEGGSKIITKGRSLESILDRRIVWYPTILKDNFQLAILKLLDDNAINPSDPLRKISRLEFVPSTDIAVTSLLIDSQFAGENLYKVIGDLCVSRGLGFKLILSDAGAFQFQLYAGVDRSYAQFANPYVVFSPKFENLINADYVSNSQLQKTIALVAGEMGVGNGRTAITVEAAGGAGSDLSRYEMYTDAKDVSRNVPGEEPLDDQAYLAQLQQKGMEELAKNVYMQSFEGQVDTSQMYMYEKDFFLGDILQVANEYGHETQSRVIEIIRSQDESGIKIYPTFSTV